MLFREWALFRETTVYISGALDNVWSLDNFQADQSRTHADKMSGQKRAACSDEVPLAKKPRVLVKMVQNWMTER